MQTTRNCLNDGVRKSQIADFLRKLELAPEVPWFTFDGTGILISNPSYNTIMSSLEK